MAREIEIKAHVKDPVGVLHALENEKGFSDFHRMTKMDQYFSTPSGSSMRIRKVILDGISHLEATTKKRSTREGMEYNDEMEFSIDDSFEPVMIPFFENIGLKRYFVKNKRGFSFYIDDLHVELVEVSHPYLGWFIEMEFVVNGDEKPFAEYMKKMKQILNICSIDERDVENRSYRSMLQH